MNENKNKELSKTMFKSEKNDNIDYSLSTHSDIEELSYYEEKEVLFFPFSSFEIKEINEINYENGKIYQIKLLYLGKYLKEFKNDKTIVENENILPNSEFKKEIFKSGLIKSEIINMRINAKEIIKKYEKFKEEIINNRNENNNISQIK